MMRVSVSEHELPEVPLLQGALVHTLSPQRMLITVQYLNCGHRKWFLS